MFPSSPADVKVKYEALHKRLYPMLDIVLRTPSRSVCGLCVVCVIVCCVRVRVRRVCVCVVRIGVCVRVCACLSV